MEKTDLRESKKEIPVYRVSSIATRPFFLSNKSNINQIGWSARLKGFTRWSEESCGDDWEREEIGAVFVLCCERAP